MNRADGVRVARPLFPEEGSGSKPTSALQLFFYRTNREVWRLLNQEWHSRLPKVGASCGRVYYAAEFLNTRYAVAMWSNPVARLLPQLTWLELRRFAIAPDAPANTASRMLGWMVRDIRTLFPDVVRLISYQDTDVHNGTIYKASGWCHAENYVSRAKRWESEQGGGRHRANRTNQAVAPRMRWELEL